MSQKLVERASRFLEKRTSRRGFLAKTALVGTAVAAAPAAYVLKPNDAYAAVCGPGSQCSNGWTVFCCTIFRGANKCPPGSFVAGWWKADSSPFCCDSAGNPRPRYYIDCNAYCTGSCSGGFCRSHACSCRCNDDPQTCDNRRHCCNYFRYGQCHREIGCAGPVVCRVVSCTPPYQLYGSCASTPLTDNRTGAHSAPCLAGPCT
ncbi:MAG TPA: hypothetical protein VIK95_01280 [Egibacteraceae bacterium]